MRLRMENDAFTWDDYKLRFCIIEGPETVQDFANMELQEIQDNIRSRRNKIFLHMEEVGKWNHFLYQHVYLDAFLKKWK